MRSQEIIEASALTLRGSQTRDLVASKRWLIRETSRIQDEFDVIYILGSWYGNLSAMLIQQDHIKFNQLINCESNSKFARASLRLVDDPRVSCMIKDANDLDFRACTKHSAVINTSCNDIRDHAWFTHVPPGVLLVLQGRDAIYSQQADCYDDLEAFDHAYPMTETLFLDKIALKDPETQYSRFMKIGRS